MAIRIPIVTEFNSKGIKQAIKQFKQLETTGQKAQFALRKAAIPATAALGGLAAGLFDATKAAIEDQAAQKALARQIRRSTKATDAQIAANEEWIETQGKLLGITDDELRPALAGLVRVTGSVTKAQKATRLAMDIAAAKGVSLGTVTKALEKAYGGNYKALGLLAPELKGMIKEGATLEQVMEKLNKKFGGEAAAAAETTEGKFKRLRVALDETKESVGEGLLPIVEGALPILQKFADWASKNPQAFQTIAGAIAAMAAATVALNAAMAVNPYVLATAFVIGLAVAFERLFDALDNISKVGGLAARIAGAIIGAPGAAQNLVGMGLESVFGKGGNQPIGPLPGGTNIAPSMAPTIATNANRGVMVTVNTGVGDPVKIGKEVNDVLDAYLRRSGGK
jgi:hypothetical protein